MSDSILLLSPASPFAPRSGAQQRTALLHAALERLGDVDVVLLEPTPGPTRLSPPAPGILAHGLWHQSPLGIGKFAPDDRLQRMLEAGDVDLRRYRVIVSRYLNPASKLRLPRGARTVVDLDDWRYHYGGHAPAPLARLKSGYAAWLARRQLRRFDAFFFVSRRDQARHPDLSSALLPNIPFDPPGQPFPQSDSTTLLFVGSLWYGPNREGIDRFLAHCWPVIRAARPAARLLLAGAAPPALRAEWERYPGVTAPGFVDDLGEAYRNAALTIAPIHSGGGTNIKILESIAYGRACVTTPHCAEAFQADLAGAGLGVARDESEFAGLCLAWLGAPGERQRQVERGRALLDRHYTRRVFDERVAQLCATDAPAAAQGNETR
ncbi:glycosyltransferase [Thiobacillus sedimenti]|uniref:Glycosyltransferase n=1 Tax=Thiobacillus sedimenti TaxID=3110231 RepID=A0ABZ1CJT4_9PROT|nr:glycosyltransferase [Thiobacillus sp. SCUT-2]WRS39645.1 glycosyltransferase [Thiobacillus sp. SCUT-2]